jgi:fructose-1,6-bisphosphatase/inositol monophosphatase family enzyme
MNIDRTIQLAHQLADASGEIIRRYFRQPHLETETKLDQVSSIVTIADQEAEEAMVAIIQRELPEDGVIREEGANIPSQSGRYWVLDPIDGTSSFVKGLPIFGTLIGLVAENQPIL